MPRPQTIRPPAREQDQFLAAEFVLGTLEGAERAHVRQRMRADPAFAGLVRMWERRLAPLHELTAPIAPPAELGLLILDDFAKSQHGHPRGKAVGGPSLRPEPSPRAEPGRPPEFRFKTVDHQASGPAAKPSAGAPTEDRPPPPPASEQPGPPAPSPEGRNGAPAENPPSAKPALAIAKRESLPASDEVLRLVEAVDEDWTRLLAEGAHGPAGDKAPLSAAQAMTLAPSSPSSDAETLARETAPVDLAAETEVPASRAAQPDAGLSAPAAPVSEASPEPKEEVSAEDALDRKAEEICAALEVLLPAGRAGFVTEQKRPGWLLARFRRVKVQGETADELLETLALEAANLLPSPPRDDVAAASDTAEPPPSELLAPGLAEDGLDGSSKEGPVQEGPSEAVSPESTPTESLPIASPSGGDAPIEDSASEDAACGEASIGTSSGDLALAPVPPEETAPEEVAQPELTQQERVPEEPVPLAPVGAPPMTDGEASGAVDVVASVEGETVTGADAQPSAPAETEAVGPVEATAEASTDAAGEAAQAEGGALSAVQAEAPAVRVTEETSGERPAGEATAPQEAKEALGEKAAGDVNAGEVALAKEAGAAASETMDVAPVPLELAPAPATEAGAAAAHLPPVPLPAAGHASLWRAVAVLALLVAAGLAGLLAYGQWHQPEEHPLVAILQNEQVPVIALRIDPQSGAVRVHAVVAEPPAGKAYHLWLVAPGAERVRLGRFRSALAARSAVVAQLDPGTLSAAKVDVTLEPLEPHAPDMPAGPVVFTGRLVPE